MINAVIDLSHWNTVSDFHIVKYAGILAAIHKVTQGLSYVDPRYLERKQPALDAGLLWGAYHFGVVGSGTDQAQFFLDTVQPLDSDLLVLDWEHSPGDAGDMPLTEAENWAAAIQNTMGRWPVLYSGQAFLAEKIAGHEDSPLKNCALWIARYSRKAAPVVPPPWTAWTLYQYTDGEHGNDPRTVEGIGPCDRDIFNGDEAALRALWIANTAST